MKLTISELRKIIREAMKTPTDSSGLALYVAENIYCLYDPKKFISELTFNSLRPMLSPKSAVKLTFISSIIAALETEPLDEETLIISKVFSYDKGYGPMMYDLVLGITGKSITPDVVTSPAAMNIWKKYAERNDVQIEPLIEPRHADAKEKNIKVTPMPNFFIEPSGLIEAHKECLKKVYEKESRSNLLQKANLSDSISLERYMNILTFETLVDSV